jgi:hypothetical protein
VTAANDHPPGALAELIELLYRAEWTKLSLAAEITDFCDYQLRSQMIERGRAHRPGGAGYPDDETRERWQAWRSAGPSSIRLLLAPGGRFRQETSYRGGSASALRFDRYGRWAAADEEGEDHPGSPTIAQFAALAQPSWSELLRPAWLPARFALELAGTEIVADRQAVRVLARPRPVGRTEAGPARFPTGLPAAHRRIPPGDEFVDQIDALVDSDLGILLRCERRFEGQTVSRQEVTSITIDPPEASEPGQFEAPDYPESADSGHESPFSGPGWQAAKNAVDLGATALSFAIRYGPHRTPSAQGKPAWTVDYPASADAGEDGQPSQDEPVSAQIVTLLYEAGLRKTDFDGELRTWLDGTVEARALSATASRNRLPGLGRLADAISETSWQRLEAVKVGLPDRYRIEHLDGRRQRKSTTVASDGRRRWRVYPDHVSVGPASPLPAELAQLADPAWLLDWRLAGGAEVTWAGRRGFLVLIRPHYSEGVSMPPAEAVIDAELGILLRLTGAPVGALGLLYELSGVTVPPVRSPGDFTIDTPAGTRVDQETGGLLDEFEVPAPVKAAVQLAGKAFTGAAKVSSFLESLRSRQDG